MPGAAGVLREQPPGGSGPASGGSDVEGTLEG